MRTIVMIRRQDHRSNPVVTSREFENETRFLTKAHDIIEQEAMIAEAKDSQKRHFNFIKQRDEIIIDDGRETWLLTGIMVPN